ncbi:MAG TPA: SDR family oxidoreductase [Ktedonobacteraceae bacterium]|nr:SDR family oxidoreductase [Ktedonobacteraceae bacterium]
MNNTEHPRRVALVTGMARGIGEATARLFAARGYRVAAIDMLETGQVVCDDINAAGGECAFYRCNVADEASVQATVAAARERFGRIDALLNIAGVVLVKPLAETTWDEYRRVVDVNLGGTFLLCKHVLPIMRAQQGGSIVNMASVSGHVGQTDHVVYGSTKGAVLAFTRALAWEVAADHIRVNSISPGSVDTPMLRSDVTLEAQRTGLPFDEIKRLREAEQAFNRWADPAEIAQAVYFLASEAASFITGTDLLVDGGWVAK